MMQLEGLKWAELRYDFMLGFSAAMTGSSFDPFFALCAYITLKQLTTPPNTEVEIPFPEWPAYETKHSFIDQHHAANVALHVLQDLESAGRHHGTTTNIAAANEPLTWREIWPAICRSLACKPKEAISASGSVPSIDSAGLFVRNNFAAWNHALINDWERPQPKTSPWPTSPDIAVEDCWKKLIHHRENTTINIEPLRESGYFGHRTLGELNTSIRAALTAAQGERHGSCEKEVQGSGQASEAGWEVVPPTLLPKTFFPPLARQHRFNQAMLLLQAKCSLKSGRLEGMEGGSSATSVHLCD